MSKLNLPFICHVRNKLNRLNVKYALDRANKVSAIVSCRQKSFSTCLSSDLSSSTGEKSLTELNDEFPQPKSIFQRVINEAFLVVNSTSVEPSITVKQISGTDPVASNQWITTILMNWPNRYQVEGVAARKTDSEKFAYLQACHKLKEWGTLDEKNNPILPNKIYTFGDKQIKNAKADLINIFQIVWRSLGNEKLLPQFQNVQVSAFVGNIPQWKSVLTLSYPEHKVFEGYSHRMSDAEKVASVKALHWLHEVGLINRKKQLTIHSKLEEQKMLENQKLPHPVWIPKELQSKMDSVYKSYQELKTIYPNFFNKVLNLTSSETNSAEVDELAQGTRWILRDSMTDEPYVAITPEAVEERSRLLYQREMVFQQVYDPKQQEIQDNRTDLPIYSKRDDILKLIQENQVVVLSGETGCGKSTQVPQYILESYISAMKGAECNIVVAQPRRISSIAIAEYVAYERAEKIGSTVGYHVRLKRMFPKGNGSMLFCTTGILLRKFFFNPSMAGVSHVIIDEVHERTIQIDILLILLKKLLQTNKNLKVIIMSASFNTSVFANYFNTSATVHVPGEIYPVKEYFLDDLPEDIAGYCRGDNMKFDSSLMARVVAHVDKTQAPGAILCFLPGWNEIKSVHESLNALLGNESKCDILYLHSKLLPDEQKKIFDDPRKGHRKIILATNIAETSITVSDVVYVVDCGFYKGTVFDANKGLSSIATRWITKASVRQRRGRAGRVRPGVCYHLFPRKVFTEMDDYPEPEILRKPLEKVVLDAKLFCPDLKVEDFLSMALQPPNCLAIQLGVQELQMLDILSEEENLTPLGKTIANFGTHPRLSTALVYAAYFRCLDPVLTISAILSLSQDPFEGLLDNSSDIKKVKSKYDFSRISDHLALYNIFNEWDSLQDPEARTAYEQKNLLDSDSMELVRQLKGLFMENVMDVGLLNFGGTNITHSINSDNIPLILSILSKAFYPNIIKVVEGEIRHGRLHKDTVLYQSLRNHKTHLQIESVASKRHDFPSPWFVFFSGMKSEARQRLMTSSVSSVPGISLLMFAGQQLFAKEDDSLTIDNWNDKLSFATSGVDSEVLICYRQMLNELFQVFLSSGSYSRYIPRSNMMEFFNLKVQPVLMELLEARGAPFVPGAKFRFTENGELVKSEL